MLLANPGGGTGGAATGGGTTGEPGGHGGRSSISSAGTVVAAASSGTSGTAASHTMTAAGPSTSTSAGGGCTGSTVRAPNVYDICHPLVMENPASSGSSIGPLQGHPLAPLPPLRNRLEPDSSRSLRRLNI
uniref:Uncharacterized protein n=1 Tax=Anopheles minimus TaxID=112268 RepID=A0A182WNC8_9DIPT